MGWGWGSLANVATGGAYGAIKSATEGDWKNAGLAAGTGGALGGPQGGIVPTADGGESTPEERQTAAVAAQEEAKAAYDPNWNAKYGAWNPVDNMGTADADLARAAAEADQRVKEAEAAYSANVQNTDDPAMRVNDMGFLYDARQAAYDEAYNSQIPGGTGGVWGPAGDPGAGDPNQLVFPTDAQGKILPNNEAIQESRMATGPVGGPVASEDWYNENKGWSTGDPLAGALSESRGVLQTVGAGSGAAWQGLNAYTDGGKFTGPGVSNNAQDAYGYARGMDLGLTANLDPYYENEARKAEERIRRTMAARGAFGSSASMDMSAEAATNLAADQAKAEAQYSLDRADRMLGQGELVGTTARAADMSSEAAAANEREWVDTLTQNMLKGDQVSIDKANAIMDSASMAEDAARARRELGMTGAQAATTGRQAADDSRFAREFLLADAMRQSQLDWYDRTVGADQQANVDLIEATLAAGGNALGVDLRNINRSKAEYDALMKAATASGNAFASSTEGYWD